MKVILLQNISGVGRKDEIKDLSEGYVRNFLFPKKLAKLATSESINRLEEEKKKIANTLELNKEKALKLLATLKESKVSIKAKTNEKGTLFKSINSVDIANSIKRNFGFDISPESISIKESIKDIRDHKVSLKMFNVEGDFVLSVEKEG